MREYMRLRRAKNGDYRPSTEAGRERVRISGREKTARYRAKYKVEHGVSLAIGYMRPYYLAHPEKYALYGERQKQKQRALGRPHFVYMYVSPKGYVAYVGRGSMQRVIAHQKDRRSSWYETDMVLHTMPARNEWHAMQLEGEWGERFQPRYNIEGIRDMPNWQAEVKARRMVTP